MLLGVLDLDVLVGSRVAARLVIAGRALVEGALGGEDGRADERGLGGEGSAAGGLPEGRSEGRHCACGRCLCLCVCVVFSENDRGEIGES